MNEVRIASEDVAARLILDGSWDHAALSTGADNALQQLATDEGLVPSADAVALSVRNFCTARGLKDESVTREWLESFGLDYEQLVMHCQIQVARNSLLVSIKESEINDWFNKHADLYRAYLLSAIAFTHESDAWLARQEINKEQLQELLWSTPLVDPSLPAGGHLGWQYAKDIPAAVTTQLQQTEVSNFTPPMLVNGYFRLYFLWRTRSPVLHNSLQQEIRQGILQSRLAKYQQAD